MPDDHHEVIKSLTLPDGPLEVLKALHLTIPGNMIIRPRRCKECAQASIMIGILISSRMVAVTFSEDKHSFRRF